MSNLCVKIHDRCRAARGKFKELSVQALSLRGTLLSIGSLWGGQRLTDEERVELEAVAVPLSESLRKLEKRLEKYRSLGTRIPGTWDQIGWAWDGNETVRRKIHDQVFPLNTSYTRQGESTCPLRWPSSNWSLGYWSHTSTERVQIADDSRNQP